MAFLKIEVTFEIKLLILERSKSRLFEGSGVFRPRYFLISV